MDPAYFSTFAALAGSAIGGLTSIATSWFTQRGQFRAEQRSHDLSTRQDLYRRFIEEASKWYADAYEHDNAKVSNLVDLYALVSRMRILSSPEIVDAADRVVRTIIEAYQSPNKTWRDVAELIDNKALNPLFDFSQACRHELHRDARF
ncbi:MAG TPA: hypothetical protein VMW19_18345 [Myxococcota bacterium]|nr:hypothetical protein [Myxococcota bacterium]